MHKINTKNFKQFGWVIKYPGKVPSVKNKSFFSVVLTEKRRVGWRIAYLILQDKVLSSMEQHPDTFESFEPVKGRNALYVSSAQDVKKIKCFYLDKPVILKKGIWHGVITLGSRSEIKITENAKVKCIYWGLGETKRQKGEVKHG